MKILMKKTFSADYISRMAGEKLRKMIIESIKKNESLILDFEDLIIASTSFFDEGIAKLFEENIDPLDFHKYIKLENLNKNDFKVLKQVSDYRGFKLKDERTHQWRLCPLGEHWVNEHSRTSKSGKIAEVDGHCRKNPKGKDIIKSEELVLIAQKHFKNLKVMPLPKSLNFPRGNDFDEIIAGWCTYWNDVLKPTHKIDPNIIKVLIALESGFEPEPKVPKGHQAIGIMQLMPETLKYLGPGGKELKEHFLDIDETSAKNPIVNIAAGIRWLFRKYELTKHKLKREPTWREVLYDYKGILSDNSDIAADIRKILDKYLKEFKL